MCNLWELRESRVEDALLERLKESYALIRISSTHLYLSGEELEQIGKLEKGVEPKFGRKQDATEDLVQMEQDEESE